MTELSFISAVAAGSDLVVDLHAVIAAVTQEVPRILTIRRSASSLGYPASAGEHGFLDALPFGPLDPAGDHTLELQLRSWVRQQTGFQLGHVEQLYTFGDGNRGPQRQGQTPRVVSIAYLALVRETASRGGEAQWRDCYRFLPWEDWRDGKPAILEKAILPRLEAWVEAAASPGEQRGRRDRAVIAFGLGGGYWDEERVLERYELLYETALVPEAHWDRGAAPEAVAALPRLGSPLALDHRRILATALGRLRGKLKYRPLVFELVAETFSLLQLQRVVEALAGVRLHKQNFRRLVEKGGLVEGTGHLLSGTGGRPAELFRFRRDVLRERPAPGVGLPGTRAQ